MEIRTRTIVMVMLKGIMTIEPVPTVRYLTITNVDSNLKTIIKLLNYISPLSRTVFSTKQHARCSSLLLDRGMSQIFHNIFSNLVFFLYILCISVMGYNVKVPLICIKSKIHIYDAYCCEICVCNF